MVTLTCSTTAAEGVALVTARVEGAAVPRRVTLANRLDGPVWPPRREGLPEAGWDEDGYVGVVPADGALVLGYASPAPPTDPPLELVRSEPVAGGERGTQDDAAPEDAGEEAVRRLGDPRPPRDAVPLPATAASVGETDPERIDGTLSAPIERTSSDPTDSAPPTDDDATPPNSDDPTPPNADDTPRRPSPSAAPPDPIRQWLDAVDERVATAEHLADADDLPAATDAVAAAGGLAGAERVADRVNDDAAALAAVAERADALAERAEAVDVPLATLRALA